MQHSNLMPGTAGQPALGPWPVSWPAPVPGTPPRVWLLPCVSLSVRGSAGLEVGSLTGNPAQPPLRTCVLSEGASLTSRLPTPFWLLERHIYFRTSHPATELLNTKTLVIYGTSRIRPPCLTSSPSFSRTSWQPPHRPPPTLIAPLPSTFKLPSTLP